MQSTKKHWDNIFSSIEDPKLGWFEKDLAQTFKLLNLIPDWENSTIFLPGVGTSTLIEELLKKNTSLVLNDISKVAIDKIKKRLNYPKAKIHWLCQDIALPIQENLSVDIWIDRAVLHFLTDSDDISGYFDNLKSLVKPDGYTVFAQFSKTGAKKCAGLNLHRYSIDELSGNLGVSFKLLSQFDYTYINPHGDPRPYIYALFKREG